MLEAKENPTVADGATCRGHGKEAVKNNIQHLGKNVKSRLREYLRNKGIEPNYNGFIHCPWHEDKNPSCKVNDEYIYCFACNKGGDIYKVAAALLSVPCDKEHFREIAADVERTLGIPEWKPPERYGKSNIKLSQSAVYRSELLKEFAKAIDAGDEEQAFFRACLLLALFMLPEAK
jgi:hypothetical protein